MSTETALATLPPRPEIVARASSLRHDEHPAAVYLAGLAEGPSRDTTMRSLTLAANEFGFEHALDVPWTELRYPHVRWLRSSLQARMAPASVNKTLSAVRGVLREAMRLDLMPADAAAKACAVPNVKGHREPAGRALERGEVSALFAHCDPATPLGARDAALLAVMYGCGLRRAEVVALDLANLDRSTGALRVIGKGNKERIVYVRGGAARALDAWLTHRGEEPGPLFHPLRRGGRILVQRMRPQAVLKVVRRAAERAGVERFSPHDIRRTFVGDLLDAGADLATVQKLAGHASPTTTARYDRRDDRAKQRATELLHVPFGAKAKKTTREASRSAD